MFARWWLLAPILLLAACASWQPAPVPANAHSLELVEVPFFPQSEYQCGPAALATVLSHNGAAVDAGNLSAAVYIPGRKGSLQAELIAATRRQGQVPYRIPGTVEALLAELAAGNPVLILQNLGIDALPRWHYAVVVGYDADGARWVLRSGVTARSLESHGTFMRRWDKAQRWALVTERPGNLPVSIGPDQALEALANAEPLLEPGPAFKGWEAALARWPDNGDLQFATANAARNAGQAARAAALYTHLLEQQPEHPAGRNNFADLLLEAGCPGRAREVLAPALQQADDTAPQVAQVLQATARDIDAAEVSEGASSCQLAAE